MTLEQLAQVVTKSEYLEGLGYFKTLQDAANEAKFLQSTDILIDGVKVNGTALTPDSNKDVDILITVEKLTTATTGYAASYQVKANGTAVGATIDIPKDFVVKSATLGTVTTADTPYTGAQVGDKYIDLTINTTDASETATHIYLPVNDLVDVYTAGNGIAVSNANAISVVVDSSNANGLSVGSNGVALALATATTTSYVQATGTYVSGTTYYTNSTGATTVDTSSFEDGVTDVSSYYVAQTTNGTAGAMSAADKTFLAGIQSASVANITQSDIEALFSTT